MIYTKSGKPIKQPQSKLIRLGIQLSKFPVLGEKICDRVTDYCNRFKDPQNASRQIKRYAKRYDIQSYEIEDCQDVQSDSDCWDRFDTLNDFFIRRRTGLPEIQYNRREIVSPVDAYTIVNLHHTNCWIKGMSFTTSKLMLDRHDPTFKLNLFIFRLAPHHYHRFHSPVYGKILSIYTIGNHYNSVDRTIIRSSKNVLTRNVRVILVLQTQLGIVYIALIGATCVGSIVLNHPKLLHALNRDKPIDDEDIRQNPILFHVEQAPMVLINEELGHFQFGGSCVVLGCSFDVYDHLSPIGKIITKHSALHAETEIDVGDCLLRY
jgi:phosphatidylserine decarboxylase precursor